MQNQGVGSETEEEKTSSEKENYANSKKEAETIGKRNSSGKYKLGHKKKLKKMKLRDLSKERREESKPQEPQPSTLYADAASN